MLEFVTCNLDTLTHLANLSDSLTGMIMYVEIHQRVLLDFDPAI